jgi:hypothetical protein
MCMYVKKAPYGSIHGLNVEWSILHAFLPIMGGSPGRSRFIHLERQITKCHGLEPRRLWRSGLFSSTWWFTCKAFVRHWTISIMGSNGAGLKRVIRSRRCQLLGRQFILESLNNISSFNSSDFLLHISINELLDTNVATTYPNLHFIPPLYLNVYTFLSELVDSLWFSQEQNLHPVAFWELI